MHLSGNQYNFSSHGAMLSHMKRALTIELLARSAVRWNGAELRLRELYEVIAAVNNTRLGDGYLTAACDPLLVAYGAVFRVNVLHDMGGKRFAFEVQSPRRLVRLQSSSCHMEHVSNKTCSCSSHEQ